MATAEREPLSNEQLLQVLKHGKERHFKALSDDEKIKIRRMRVREKNGLDPLIPDEQQERIDRMEDAEFPEARQEFYPRGLEDAAKMSEAARGPGDLSGIPQMYKMRQEAQARKTAGLIVDKVAKALRTPKKMVTGAVGHVVDEAKKGVPSGPVAVGMGIVADAVGRNVRNVERIRESADAVGEFMGSGAASNLAAKAVMTQMDVVSRPEVVAKTALSLAQSMADSYIEFFDSPGEQLEESTLEFMMNGVDVLSMGVVGGSRFNAALRTSREAAAIVRGAKAIAPTGELPAGVRALLPQGSTNFIAGESAGETMRVMDNFVESAVKAAADSPTANKVISKSIEKSSAEARSTLGMGVAEKAAKGVKAPKAAPTEAAKETARGVLVKNQAIKDAIAAKQGPRTRSEYDALRRAQETKAKDAGIPKPNDPPNAQSGMIHADLAGRLASAGLMGAFTGTAGGTDERPFSFWGAVPGAVFGLLIGGKDIFSGSTNFEKNARDLLYPALSKMNFHTGSAKFMMSETAAKAAVGGVAGAMFGGSAGAQSETSPVVGAIIGAGTGALLGAAIPTAAGSRTAKQVGQWVNLGKVYDRLFVEGGEWPEYLRPVIKDLKARMYGRLEEIEAVRKALPQGGTDAAIQADKYLRGDVSIFAVPEEYRDAVGAVREILDRQTVDLILHADLGEGLIATLDSNFGKYFPTKYLKYEQENELTTVSNYLREMGEPLSRLSDQNYFKRKYVPEHIQKDYGAIKDNPRYIFGKHSRIVEEDLATHKLMGHVASSPDLVLDPAVHADVNTALKNGFKPVTENGVDKLEKGKRTFKKLTGNRWGVLRDRYVDADVWDALNTQREYAKGVAGFLQRSVQGAHHTFKAAKITFNPATLLRNIYGQIPLNHLAGVSPWDRKAYTEAIHNYRRGDGMFKEARAVGLFGGSWHQAEIDPLIHIARVNDKSSATGMLSKFVDVIEKNPLNAGLKKMRAFHEGSDHVSKMLIYNHARRKLGKSPMEAANYVKEWVFDYRDVPEWLKVYRTSVFGAPFISFSYKAMPKALTSAIAFENPRQMLRFWAYPSAFAAANEISARTLGVIPEGEEGVIPSIKRNALEILGYGTAIPFRGLDPTGKRHLPEYAGTQQVLIPGKDELDRKQFMDLTYSTFWGDAGEMNQGKLGRSLAQLGIPFPKQFEPGSPILQSFLMLFTGRDPFSDREIVGEEMTGVQAFLARSNWIAKQFGPQFYTTDLPKVMRAFEGDVETDPYNPGKVASIVNMLGVRVRSVDDRSSIQQEIYKAEKEKRELESRKTSLENQGKRKYAAQAEVKIDDLGEKIRKLIREKRETPKNPKVEKALRARRKRGRDIRRENRK